MVTSKIYHLLKVVLTPTVVFEDNILVIRYHSK